MKPAIVGAVLAARKRAVTVAHPNIYTICFVALLSACQPKTRHTAELIPAFYHWKATFAPTLAERATLDSLDVKTLYIRFFDVDWDRTKRTAIPKATIHFRQRPDPGMRIVPVVYITNRTMANLAPANVPELAENLTKKIRQLADQQSIHINEIQIDCDWTRTTRGTYFSLLKAISQKASLPLSATIRLHQVKFAAQTGVPPVNRGMLMAYNTGDWKLTDTRNSILDLRDLKAYADYLPGYPLPLDIALPLFRWTVVYRNGRFLTLLNNVDQTVVRAIPGLQQQADTARYVATRDTMALGMNLRRGDLLRTEFCSQTNLKAAGDLLVTQLPDQKRTFTLYHLDSAALHPYAHDDLKTLLHHP
ncbi:hypothetical protein [Fibrella forsythiae]|uniref:Lipoprotein n=1 Tax=Fibrella forsythiae TaxID=2817061 RepID=A0ABS3JIA2_9BACT|nr:hypothetical protein [Fibrella forsythiae]MBO0948602.1 hypothetical protein [Fibrella forsythiae]